MDAEITFNQNMPRVWAENCGFEAHTRFVDASLPRNIFHREDLDDRPRLNRTHHKRTIRGEYCIVNAINASKHRDFFERREVFEGNASATDEGYQAAAGPDDCMWTSHLLCESARHFCKLNATE
jgi:hypothetical protein